MLHMGEHERVSGLSGAEGGGEQGCGSANYGRVCRSEEGNVEEDQDNLWWCSSLTTDQTKGIWITEPAAIIARVDDSVNVIEL